MMLKGRADLLQPQGIHIRHNGHTVGVAHIDAGDPPEVIVHFQWDIHQRCTSHVHSGQVGGQSAVGPHLHLPQSLAPAGDGLEAAEGINGQLLLLHTVGVQPLGHAADAVAAHPALAAVGVEDAHHGIRPGGARCADADDAVCPDGKMPPGQLFRKGRDVLRHTGCAAVQIDVIVGAALHFGK